MSEIATMLLADDLFPDLLSGKKRLTIRRGRRDVALGALEFVATHDENTRAIVDVRMVQYARLRHVPTSTLVADGFASLEDAVEALQMFYPDLDADTEVTVIGWELLS